MAGINPFKSTWKLIAINLAGSFLVMLVFSPDWHNSFKAFAISYIWNFVIFISQWMVIVYTNEKIGEYISWSKRPIIRSLVLSAAIVVISPLAFVLFNSILSFVFLGALPKNAFQLALNVVFVAFGATLFFSAVGFFKAWKASLLETEKVKTQMLAYKYESLQNQINPHFLFNSFNVLSDLVYENQNTAVKFIKQLSQLFRYVLDSRDKELVPIAEELDFIKSFAYLLQTRFEDKLTIAIDIDTNENELIVPMALQLLIENSVKHNEISTAKPLNISLSRTSNYIEVVNNLQSKNTPVASTKTGLSNLYQQYSYFTNEQILVEKTDQFFSVSVPIIKAET